MAKKTHTHTLREEEALGKKGKRVRHELNCGSRSFADETGTTHGFGDVLGVNDRIKYMSSGVVSPSPATQPTPFRHK